MLTSAIPVGGRVPVPLKITSAMRSPRSRRALCSPSTQVMASERLDFPQPFGPTTAAMPSRKFQPRPVGEGFEPEQFEFFQLVQITPSSILDFGFAIGDEERVTAAFDPPHPTGSVPSPACLAQRLRRREDP